ncbi:MAG TPA: PilN domain-containing protein [Telluria sp.]|nr:PilN domain-containing protein [Telluria sp.]
MRKVHIDFAPRSVRRTLFLAGLPAWAAAAIALVLAASAGYAYLTYGEDKRAFEAELASARARRVQAQPMKVAVTAPVLSPAEAAAVNAVVMQLNLPWRELRDAVRAATPQGVALLALEPDAKKQAVRLTAEARTSEDMVGYVERLKQQPLFASVVLARHEISDQDPNRPLRFQVDAQWRQAR